MRLGNAFMETPTAKTLRKVKAHPIAAPPNVRRPHRRRLVCQEAVARQMHGWVLVLALLKFVLANVMVWFAIAQGPS